MYNKHNNEIKYTTLYTRDIYLQYYIDKLNIVTFNYYILNIIIFNYYKLNIIIFNILYYYIQSL